MIFTMIRYGNIIFNYIKLLYNFRNLLKNEKNDLYLIKGVINNIKDAGGIAIKLSQWCIPRLELMYPNNKLWLKECEQLYDNCNIHSLSYTKEVYNKSFNRNMDEDYDIIEILGSGSIGQVYKVYNKQRKKEEIIKVRHPDIESEVKLFKIVLYVVNTLFGAYIHSKFPFDIYEFFQCFEKQLNFIEEANNCLYFYDIYKDNNYILIPEIKSVSERMLIMSYIESKKVENTDIKNVNLKITNLFYLFVRNNEIINNFNHGDLHKGNWGYLDDKLVIYDFGFCYSANEEQYNIVKMIPTTFEGENMNRLEDNQMNITTIALGLIKGEKDDELKEKVSKLIKETFVNCYIVNVSSSDSTGSPEKLLQLIMKLCIENKRVIESKLLNFFILFTQCRKMYKYGDIIKDKRTSNVLLNKIYVDIIILCDTYNIFDEYKHHLIDTLNKYDAPRKSIFDTLEYDSNVENELYKLIKQT